MNNKFKVGDLVKIKPGKIPASTWMQEAQVKEVPLLIVGARRHKRISDHPGSIYSLPVEQYQVIYNGETMWIYKKILEEIVNGS
jgi:hypothetical protein